MSFCCCGVISRFSQTNPFLDDKRSRTSPASTSGSVAVRSSMASSLSMIRRGSPNNDGVLTSVARIAPLRSTISGRAVAIASCAAVRRVAVAVAHHREHDESSGDDREHSGECDHRQSNARACLRGTIDIAPIEQRANKPLPPGLRRTCGVQGVIRHRLSSG